LWRRSAIPFFAGGVAFLLGKWKLEYASGTFQSSNTEKHCGWRFNHMGGGCRMGMGWVDDVKRNCGTSINRRFGVGML
jgi:hypothetical protein